MTSPVRPRSWLFVDTSGFYASISRRDAHHEAARAILEQAAREAQRLFTTT